MNNKSIDRSIVSMLRSMFGGAEGSRTPGLLHAKQALSRIMLSTPPFLGVRTKYNPIFFAINKEDSQRKYYDKGATTINSKKV